MSKKTPLDKEQIKLLIENTEESATIHDMAEKLDKTPWQIKRMLTKLRQFGFKIEPFRGEQTQDEVIRELLEEYKEAGSDKIDIEKATTKLSE